MLLLAGSLLLLIIASANVTSLVLARTDSRAAEIALRHALGGHRSGWPAISRLAELRPSIRDRTQRDLAHTRRRQVRALPAPATAVGARSQPIVSVSVSCRDLDIQPSSVRAFVVLYQA